MTDITGGCLCGAVRYVCTAQPIAAGHCHCIDCRKTSGTAHSSHMAVPKAATNVSGDTSAYDRAADSGNMITRMFCPTCGSAVYSTNSGMVEMIFLRASSLDDPEMFKPAMLVYTSRAASWDRPDSKLPAFDTMPPPGSMP